MKQNEQGAVTLLITMIILIVMTLLVISSLNINAINFRIAGNMQIQKVMDSAAQEGIEQVISQSSHFSSTSTSQTYTVGMDSVTVSAPECVGTQVMGGFSAVWDMAPEVNVWEVISVVSDATTGAGSTIHQGVKIQQLAGSCP